MVIVEIIISVVIAFLFFGAAGMFINGAVYLYNLLLTLFNGSNLTVNLILLAVTVLFIYLTAVVDIVEDEDKGGN